MWGYECETQRDRQRNRERKKENDFGLSEKQREIRNREDVPEEKGASKTNVYLVTMQH